MPEWKQTANHPLGWPVADLVKAYSAGELSPVEVTGQALQRIEDLDPIFNAYITPLPELARQQALAAEQAYRSGEVGPLAGVPISIKDTFQVASTLTTFGSLVFRDHVANQDSGVVRRLRAAGAVFIGKTNTAEFGQSATSENRLLGDARNPWNPHNTSGGSSGGGASSVAAGLATLALGADGGGSIRIPAAFTGLFGMKPTYGLCNDEGGLRAFTEFAVPGSLSWNVADARAILGVLAESAYPRGIVKSGLRIGWCPRPEGLPVSPDLAATTATAVATLAGMGHRVSEIELPIAGWAELFDTLVLWDEFQERGHLLETESDLLTDYELKSLLAARRISQADAEKARRALPGFRSEFQKIFEANDLIVAPTTAVPAFPVGRRPTQIDGTPVGWLRGAAPFTAPFNVTGNPGASLPCGFAGDLPVGLQIVAPLRGEALLLDLAEDLEEALAVDRSPVRKKWGLERNGDIGRG